MDLRSMVLAVAAGAVLPIQVAFNAQLARHGAGTIWASMVSFGVGTAVLGVVFATQSASWPTREAVSAIPWWAWAGGLLGAFYVATTVYAAPKIGAALLFALLVAGQLTMSAGLDHLGALGLPEDPFSVTKAFGIILIIAGVVLVQR